jgi:hypothetical protein
MEEQIEAGRDPAELFSTVLQDSECVGVLGVCVGIGLAYPQECLGAVASLIVNPALWLMDIARMAKDSTSSSAQWDPFGMNAAVDEINLERAKRPQRDRDIRGLSYFFMLGPDESLKESFQKAVSRFPELVPCFFEDERADSVRSQIIRERLQEFALSADEANYVVTEAEGGRTIHIRTPDDARPRSQEMVTAIARQGRLLELNLWAQRVLMGESEPPFPEIENIVREVQELQQSEDFRTAEDWASGPDRYRTEAIAGVAALILVKHLEGAKSSGLLTWAREVVLAAASAPYGGNGDSFRMNQYPMDVRVSAARGLCGLAAHQEATANERAAILGLIADPQVQVVSAVIQGLSSLWERDAPLVWNALSLALSLSAEPVSKSVPPIPFAAYKQAREAEAQARRERITRLIRSHTNYLQRGQAPKLPRIPAGTRIHLGWDLVAAVLHSLPLEPLIASGEAKWQLVRLLDDLMAWTIARNVPPSRRGHRMQDPPYQWNPSFLEFACRLGHQLTEQEMTTHVLDPIKKAWRKAPGLMEDLLFAYIRTEFATVATLPDRVTRTWISMCTWVIDEADLLISKWAEAKYPRAYHYLERGVPESVRLIVFGSFGGCLLTDKWPHARVFADLVSKWVSVVGHYPDPFSDLLRFLEQPGWTCTPEPALTWLNDARNACPDASLLWAEHQNGDRTALLLQRMYNEHDHLIQMGQNSLERYAQLVDSLADHGVRLAAVLQRRLDV